MPSHPSNPSADSLENNPFITARNIDDLKDGMRALGITIRMQTEVSDRQTLRTKLLNESNDRVSASIDKLTAAVDRLESTIREVTTITFDPAMPSTVETAEVGVDLPGRQRKSRQTG